MKFDWQREGYEPDAFTSEIKDRLGRGFPSFIVATGHVRTGKSFSLMSIAENVDPNFSVDKVHFMPQEFKKGLEVAKAGEFLILDEPAAEFSSRRFMSYINFVLSTIFITFASKRVCVGMATPVVPQVDINMSRLMDFLIVMSSKQRGCARIYQHWTDARTGKFGDRQIMYGYIYPPFIDRRDQLQAYEAKKKEYQKEKYSVQLTEFLSANEDVTSYLNVYVEKILKSPGQYKGERGSLG